MWIYFVAAILVTLIVKSNFNFFEEASEKTGIFVAVEILLLFLIIY